MRLRHRCPRPLAAPGGVFSGGAWRCYLREAAWLPLGKGIVETKLSEALL